MRTLVLLDIRSHEFESTSPIALDNRSTSIGPNTFMGRITSPVKAGSFSSTRLSSASQELLPLKLQELQRRAKHVISMQKVANMQFIENKRNTITKPSVTAKNRESEEREDGGL